MKKSRKLSNNITGIYFRTPLGKKLKKEISGIFPGKQEKILLEKFLKEKIKRIILTLLGGILILLLFITKESTGELITSDGRIKRGDIGSGKNYIQLDAKIEGNKYFKIPVEIMSQQYTEEEAVKKINEIFEKLPNLIKGENQSLRKVTLPLNLINRFEKSPIEIRWESDNRQLLDEKGRLGKRICEKGETVNLTAVCEYNSVSMKNSYDITVFPGKYMTDITDTEEIEEYLTEKEMNSRTEKFFTLPKEINGEKIEWSESKNFTVLWIILLIIFSALSISMGMDREIHKKYLKRNQEMKIEYARFVSQLQIMISSGLSIREAICKIGKDYQRKKKQTGKEICVYEELLLAVKMLKNGSSEAEALQYFAKRTGILCYKKMVSIITQNLKYGTEGLKQNLKEEVENAFEERKIQAKRLGEEAETKLLVPMMIMMGIVLVIILVPAYFSFANI